MNQLELLTDFTLRIIEFAGQSPDAFVKEYRQRESEIKDILSRYGALKFTGVPISSQKDFEFIINSISDKFLDYVDGNSPRTKLSSHVYTSTEYDKTQRITMHNELSYSAKWPNKIFFTCLVPSASGGETLLVDSREILRKMELDIVDTIRKRGLTYIRNLHGGNGLSKSWQDTFETRSKERVEHYCRSLNMYPDWTADGGLRLRQPSKGIICHRETNEEVWFNQIDQFHPYQLGEEMFESLSLLYDTPLDFPTYVTYGDGGEIEIKTVKKIKQVIDACTIAPTWSTNELLMVDNELVGHGRNPYTGNRTVLVAMSL